MGDRRGARSGRGPGCSRPVRWSGQARRDVYPRNARPCAPASRAALATCRAALAKGQGEHPGAAILFARAAKAWHALPRPYDALLARERQAASLLAAGNHGSGLPLLAEVRQGLSTLWRARRC